LHNPAISSKRLGDGGRGVVGVEAHSRFAGNDLAGVVKYNRRMRLGLFVISFVCLFCGFDEVAYDFQYTKEFGKQGNRLGAEYEVVLKQWVREHHL
jgi:hypothetical protein